MRCWDFQSRGRGIGAAVVVGPRSDEPGGIWGQRRERGCGPHTGVWAHLRTPDSRRRPRRSLKVSCSTVATVGSVLGPESRSQCVCVSSVWGHALVRRSTAASPWAPGPGQQLPDSLVFPGMGLGRGKRFLRRQPAPSVRAGGQQDCSGLGESKGPSQGSRA